ncbi:MAG: alpha-2-macroglobulin family protein, partial [Bacteroidota bacterium]
RESQLDPTDGLKRYNPVSMFKGPLKTNNQGIATVKFTMPEYIGAVRIMVVGTEMGSYGNAEKSIPVRSDIIMQPSIPRVLNPGDEFILPVALFIMNPIIKNAQFSIKTEGPLEVVGEKAFNIDFTKSSESDIKFKIRVKEAIGQAKIIIEGKSGNIQIENETNIRVVPTSPRLYDQKTEKLAKGQAITMNVPAIGIDGTNAASLNISVFPNMDFDHRLKWLINYPYGCLEQVTSTIFPQLYLKKMDYFHKDEIREIDNNINEGINRLNEFMLSSGGFSYWPGLTEESEWGSNYATHFLVEAKKAGYSVPDYLYDNAIKRLKNSARQHSGQLTTRTNRAFILALAGQQVMAEMNILMENELSKMNNAERWMLATAYYLAGAENISEQIIRQSGVETEEHEPFSYNFGSKDRDNAIILYCATILKKEETAELIAKNIAQRLSGRDYLSTQSSGYLLLALGKYFESIGLSAASGQVLAGSVKFADGQVLEFNQKGNVLIPVRDNFDKNIQISLSNSSNIDQVYVGLSWSGVPMVDKSKALKKNLNLQVSWYDENGNTINPASLKQGDTFYGRFSVENISPVSKITEIALLQIIPSGWQIENVRLNNTLIPSWMQKWNLNKENYSDIRDDRIMWFFDLKDNQVLDFVVKINCVSAGEFWLPGTLLEAMYSNDYKATTEGRKVHVKSFK